MTPFNRGGERACDSVACWAMVQIHTHFGANCTSGWCRHVLKLDCSPACPIALILLKIKKNLLKFNFFTCV